MRTTKLSYNTSSESSRGWLLCIISVWITIVYSVVIQYTLIEIPNGMLISGLLVLITYYISCLHKAFNIEFVFSKEALWIVGFMIYMLPVGMITSPDAGSHLNQWITSLEYMFMMIVISSIIMNSGTKSFYVMILAVAIIMAIIFLKAPVLYVDGRYSISREVNPNGLGMTFTAGIWAVLYLQQKKMPLLISLGVVALLVYCVTKTGSRKALIAAGIIIVLWFALGYFHQIFSMKSKCKIFAFIFAIILLVFLGKEFIRIYAGSEIEARMGGLDSEVSTGMRSLMYKEGWELFLSNPIFGIGFQGFKYFHGGYSHSSFVEIPVSGGIIGSFIYFSSYFFSLKKCFLLHRICKHRENLSNEAIDIKMIIVMWVAMLFYCTCIIHPYQFDSFVMFGIIYGHTAYIERKISLIDHGRALQQEKKSKWVRK